MNMSMLHHWKILLFAPTKTQLDEHLHNFSYSVFIV